MCACVCTPVSGLSCVSVVVCCGQEGALVPTGSRLLFSKLTAIAGVRDRVIARLRLPTPVKARLWYRPEAVDTCPWVPLRALDATVEEAQVRV
jgi:hypothetical protein